MRAVTAVALVAVVAVLAPACGAAPAPVARVRAARGEAQRGKATWYGAELHGHATASGEPFDMNALTAAHRTLPLGAIVRVTNLRNGRTVQVRINDRGPFGGKGRIIDLSRAAARKLRMIDAGVVEVELLVLSVPPPRVKKSRRQRR